MLTPKKQDTPFGRRHTYLNYGILGLASMVYQSGLPSIVYHGKFKDPKSFWAGAVADDIKQSTFPLLISLPSYFAVSWASEFCRIAKRECPDIKIILGGRWVIDGDPEWLRRKIPEATHIISGLAENQIYDLLSISHVEAQQNSSNGTPSEINYPLYNYSILDEWWTFQPSIEVSRGCGMKCNFCVESKVKYEGILTPNEVHNRIEKYQYFYGSNQINPYFEASIFRPPISWCREFSNLRLKSNTKTLWRCESRVDTLTPEHIKHLATAGLKVLDLGLESASHTQLTNMRKTTNTSHYLKRASDLLQACSDNDVWAKVNVLLYPGETMDTLNETINWLLLRKNQIKGVSTSPLFIYGTNRYAFEYLDSLKQLGASVVESDSLKKKGYAKIHLSSEISAFQASEEVLRIARTFMNENDYFDLKSFSYFDRQYSYDDFIHDLTVTPIEKLPFSLST